MVYYKKTSGKRRVEYNAAVEEALCFGWIDSTVKKIDDECFAQRFSRRNPKTGYSQANKERLGKLIAEGKVSKDVPVTLGDISTDNSKSKGYSCGNQGRQRSVEEFPRVLGNVQANSDCFY
ncbi:MAG: hypothetical protein WCA79_11890 [Anaerolineales bacterium]